MKNTLYITRNGLLEPLGQSQVFAYLRGLSRDYKITLITYEKPEDWSDSTRMNAARLECQAHNIRWLPQKFRMQPPLLAPALSLLGMILLLWRECRARTVYLIHARSYIPAGAALIVKRLTGTPFIFDMRALWPEELITAQRIKRGSWAHRILVLIERECLKQADEIVSLTHAALDYLYVTYPSELAQKTIIVIPTCADLERFTPGPTLTSNGHIHGCIGTVLSGWFRIDWLAQWINVAARRNPATCFQIITRDSAPEVRAKLDPQNLLANRLKINACESQQMPDAIRSHALSIMFFSTGRGKLGSSPTRMAEVLGCGIPVIANAGVGDVAKIVKEHRVGILVAGSTDEQLEAAMDEFDKLLDDPELGNRCRQTAVRLFSLEVGTQAYRTIYSKIGGI